MIDSRGLVARLAARHASPLREARATEVAEHLLKHAAALGLDAPDDVLDVLDLWLSFAEHTPGFLYAQGLLRVVLSIKRWPVATRVAFLRRHLAGGELGPADDALAWTLFGMGEEVAT
jgi:hypothetical protein